MAIDPTEDPFKRLAAFLAILAEKAAVSLQALTLILFALFVAIVGFLMLFFRTFVPNLFK